MRPNVLKGIYTAGAIVLGGLIAVHALPPTLDAQAQMALTYLILHSFLPSAKSGSPQG